MSLLEIMIALLIGSLLILALVQVFAASRTAYQMSEGMARVQENARFAMDFLQRDIRMAGHYGCVNDQSHLQKEGSLEIHLGAVGDLGNPLNFGVSVVGYEAPNTGPEDTVQIGEGGDLPAGLPATIQALEPLPGSDILVLRYLGTRGAPVTNIVDTGSEEILTLADGSWGALTTDGVAEPTFFGVADCTYVDVFAGSSAGGEGVVTVNIAPTSADTTDLIGRYTPQPSGQSMLYRAESLVYYVAISKASGNPALFRARYLGGAYEAEELVEGIENMQLLYGLDRVADLATAPPSGYISVRQTAGDISAANEAVGWRRVGMVQVGLLASSPNLAAAEQAEARNVLGVDFTPPAENDRLYRASYEATIALRNRLYGN
ncbi:PilW family protein [Luteimonas suaedae]|uniref:PilW family protein n=1 Tax=Luteimonas suaedae TaxID=2605430 RepID=UPI0011EE1D88|nr:PilW family protein [Luteimonas suaedae]